MIALDTETTGVDLRHGAKPYFITTCDGEGNQTWWEWDVDPLTREPNIPAADLEEIRRLLRRARGWAKFADEVSERHVLVGQNVKFDVAALEAVGVTDWPWEATRDTLLAAHLLASNQPKDLTSLALLYLGIDIKPYEDRLREACLECRRVVQQARLRVKRRKPVAVGRGDLFDDGDEPYADWRIAEAGLAEMPSARETVWKYDGWLPRALAAAEGKDEDHYWRTVLRDYANADSAATVALWPVMWGEIQRRGLDKVYRERLRVLPVGAGIETRGVTLNRGRLEELKGRYQRESREAGAACVKIASKRGYELVLPKGASPNGSLRTFCFDVLKLPPLTNPKAKTAAPTLDSKNAIPYYLQNLPVGSTELEFVRTLVYKRGRDTAVSYLEAYERFWIPLGGVPDSGSLPGRDVKGRSLAAEWFRLHPSLNPTGSDTLRWSSSNPNGQNISKRESQCKTCDGDGCDACDGTGKEFRSLRYAFGPAPGREWWSMDGRNLERRLPAYECEEEEIIALFERPDEPPYFGSEHLLIAHILFPREFEECLRRGKDFKTEYKSTIYQNVKNGNFAVQYGAVDRPDGKGTADRTFRLPGAHARIKARFARQTEMNRYLIDFATKHGYVETIPDRTVDPEHGYPLLCTRTEYGRILETVPFNYRYQGSACWWMQKAMSRCEDQLAVWRREGFDAWITLQVHDELVFDFPRGGDPRKDPKRSNLPRARTLQKLMEEGGNDLGIPTPVSVTYHPEHWAEGVDF